MEDRRSEMTQQYHNKGPYKIIKLHTSIGKVKIYNTRQYAILPETN
jgi:hypothetical protein